VNSDAAPKLLFVATVSVTLRSFLLPYARYFRSLGWRVDGAADGVSGCPSCAAAFDAVHEVPFSRNPLAVPSLVTAARRLRLLAEAEKYDLVHVHTPVAAFVTRLALRRLRSRGLRVVYTAHGFHFFEGGPPLRNALFLALEKLAGSWTDRLVVINGEDETAARRHRLVPPERLRLFPGVGVDTAAFARESVSPECVAAVRKEMRLPEEAPFFLMVAEFNPGKRHRDLLRAFAGLPPRAPAPHLVCAGEGALLEETKRLAAEFGVAERVRFPGYRRDVKVLLKGAAALVLPSEREGLPVSVLEALAMETPVIGADARGIRDLLRDGCGLLVPVGDVRALCDALCQVLARPEEARARAERGRRRAREMDISRLLALSEELYRELLETGGSPGEGARRA